MCARTHGAFGWACALLLTLASLLTGSPGHARRDPDESALDAIKRARDELYLYMQFEAAESLLLSTIQECAERCRPSTVAKAWMYIGIVRSTPNEDLVGAKEAFVRAVDADPETELDDDLAAERSRALWEEVKSQVEGEQDQTPEGWAFECTPATLESQTGRRIPISCPAADGAERMLVRYREWGDQEWKSAAMRRVGTHFRVILPCSATQSSGPLRFFVEERNAGGDVTGSYGTSRRPIELIVNDQSTVVPAFPGSPPPEVCEKPVACPPGLPDCVPEGGRCEETKECKEGLVCIRADGEARKTCRPAEPCEVDDDCNPGRCERGVCTADDRPPASKHRQSFVGLHFGLDLVYLPGAAGICTRQEQAASDPTYRCFSGDAPYPDAGSEPVDVSAAGRVNGGFGLATVRFLLSYDYALGPNVTVGGRGGFALGGAPEGFVPVHAEGRVTYWFGRDALTGSVRPHVFAGAGVAEVSAPVEVAVHSRNLSTDEVTSQSMQAWGGFGFLFLAGGGGLSFALADVLAVSLDLSAMVTFPDSTLVLEPTAGLVLGI